MELCARLLPLFEEAGVRVIRVGLHAAGELWRAAGWRGPTTPPSGSWCESTAGSPSRLLPELERRGPGAYQVRVCPRQLSAAIGQRRANCGGFGTSGAIGCALRRTGSWPFGGFLLERQETRNVKGKLAQ